MSDSTSRHVHFGEWEPCGHCGGWHQGTCPRINALEYFPNGTLKRVEYHGDQAAPALPMTIRQDGHTVSGSFQSPNEWESCYASSSDLLGHMPTVN